MQIITRQQLHKATQFLKKIKIQLIGELPHEGQYALHFVNGAISTGILNNTVEIKIHLPSRTFSFYADEIGKSVNLLDSNASEQVEHIIKVSNLEVPDGGFPTIPEEEFESFLSYATKANEYLELFRMGLSGNFTFNHLWGHNFDFSVVSYFDSSQIGVGISPGDEYSDQPYLYVNPWPVPDNVGDIEIPVGRWWTDKWTGIMVSWEELQDVEDPVVIIRQLYDIVRENLKISL